MIDYRIEVGSAHAHRFVVTLRIARPQARQRLSLPVWIPGSYLVREFARHLSPLSAQQGQQVAEVVQLDKSSWEVDCSGKGALTVSYEVYAFDTSVRAAFLDSRRGFFNGTSVFLKAEGLEDQPQRLKITGLPKGWGVATGLAPLKVNAQGLGDYQAPDYDSLVDHPVELGTFWRGSFMAKGVPHEFIVSGASADLDGPRLLADTQRICEAQIAFWHGRRKPAFDRYVFMLNAVDDGYGGLEHRNSTALICARRDLPRTGRPVSTEAYQTLLGLISHEYFHTWNVKRLKPAEFAPYDYTQENYTRMLWFFEGFTSYYDDQFLLRTGLIDAKTYVRLLSKTINQVQATPGRHLYSVAQASFDAWTRYYRPDENTANGTVSYYTKGSLVGLCLDLSLRQCPAEGKATPSLDGVMLRLWQLQRPIHESDIAQALQLEAAGGPPAWTGERSWAELLQTWVHGTDELPLQSLLGAAGVNWISKPAPLAQRLGVRLGDAGGSLKVQAVMRHGVAERAGLSASDELIALDGWRLRKSDDLALWHNERQDQPLLICRDQAMLTLTLPALSNGGQAGRPKGASGDTIALTLAENLDAQTAQRRHQWLKS
ncbi:M61 family metallopeptidase [Aquabacterium sp.]|uniref:M61 family metallopeptidase n=1 Tax=Aquabacterium sp. TaxID=1872578 RepID=UPI003D6CB40B